MSQTPEEENTSIENNIVNNWIKKESGLDVFDPFHSDLLNENL